MEPTSPFTSATPYASEAVLVADLDCLGCGYNLHTQAVSGRCPECGRSVEESLLVLPKASAIAAAINLAAWAWLVKLVLGCMNLEVVGWVMLLIAVYQLRYQCDLLHLRELGSRIKWLWAMVVVSASGALLGAVIAVTMLAGMIAGGLSAPRVSYAMSRSAGTGGTSTNVAEPSIEGSLNISTDSQGQTVAQVSDDDGQVIDSQVLTAGQAVTVKDVDGNTITLTLSQNGDVMVQAAGAAAFTVGSGAGGMLRTTNAFGGLLGGTVDLVAGLTGIVATVLYILVCVALARRARLGRLVGNFRTILWLLALGTAGVVIGPAAVVATQLGMGGGLLMMAPGIVILVAGFVVVLVGGIWLIVASFNLTTALRTAPREWSEISAPRAEVVAPPARS